MGAGSTGAEGAIMTQSDNPSPAFPPQGPASHGATPYGSTPQAATSDDARPTGQIMGGEQGRTVGAVHVPDLDVGTEHLEHARGELFGDQDDGRGPRHIGSHRATA